MDQIVAPGRLSRVLKMALDDGEAATVEEATEIFATYRMHIAIGTDVVTSSTAQAALLTAVNTARRCCPGGVTICGALDVPLLVPWRDNRTLLTAVEDLGGVAVTTSVPGIPRVVLGNAPLPMADAGTFVVRATFDGWCGGVIPLEDGCQLRERDGCTPAGVLAGALAVSEAFQFLRGNPLSRRRSVGLSLWKPEPSVSWLDPADPGPTLTRLPARVWLIGLGHLGQAYLWTLGLLPYACATEVVVVLQDDDIVSEANESTSLLTTSALVGRKKTRALAGWCEERGFTTVIDERRFGARLGVDVAEPRVALCGVDNPAARAALEDVGFARIIEGGLGRGTEEYLAFQVHTFPGRRSARDYWTRTTPHGLTSSVPMQPAYRDLAARGYDACGLTELAGRTVGAPFVGAVTASLVVAELLRMALGAHRYDVIDGTLRSLDGRTAVASPWPSDAFNPGLTAAVTI